MSVRQPRTPSYRLHKPTGQAVVTLSGRDFYLGKFGSSESRGEYDRLVTEWLTNGRTLPRPASPIGSDLTVNELLDAASMAAERAGLVSVTREPGCKLSVSVLDLPEPEPEAGPSRRPLYGPIPPPPSGQAKLPAA